MIIMNKKYVQSQTQKHVLKKMNKIFKWKSKSIYFSKYYTIPIIQYEARIHVDGNWVFWKQDTMVHLHSEILSVMK